MTAQPLPLQTLIDEIDGVLSKATPRLPWVMAGDVDQQRRLLEQTRSYLVALQQQAIAPQPAAMPTPEGTDPLQPPLPQGGLGARGNLGQGLSVPAESAQQVLQSVLQEMSYLRASIMQPMRMDLESLRQERDALLQEVRQLEIQRQQGFNSSPINQQQIITEFLQSLMGRMQETLTAQVGQMLGNAQVMALQDRAIAGSVGPLAAAVPDSGLTPSQRLEQVQMLQTQSDQLLLKLDSTLKVFFESLQRNVHSYQDSLNEELMKMHMLGQQGEAVLSGLINRLAQQLAREASSYLQSPTGSAALPPPVTAHATSMPHSTDDPVTVLQPDATQEIDAAEKAQIDELLADLRTDALATVPPLAAPQPQRNDLGLLGLDLEELELDNPLDNAAEVDLLSEIDEELTLLQSEEEEITEFQLDDQDLTFLQVNEQDWETLQSELVLDSEERPAAVTDLNSAVELLSQLNLNPPEPEVQSTVSTDPLFGDFGDAPIVENRYDEIDDFYESLFGVHAVSPEPEDEDPIDQPAAATPSAVQPHPAASASMAAVDPGDSTAAGGARGAFGDIASGDITSGDIFVLDSVLETELFDSFADPALTDASGVALAGPHPERVEVDASLGLSSSMADSLRPAQSDEGLLEDPLTLEGMLFGEAEPRTEAEAIASEDDFLRWEDALSEVETSTADSILPQFEPLSLAADQPRTLNSLEEEAFELASPEEDLLATGSEAAPVRLDLTVDDWTLEKLQQDLSVFEGNSDEDWATLATNALAPLPSAAQTPTLEVPEDEDTTVIFNSGDLADFFSQTAATPAASSDFPLDLSALDLPTAWVAETPEDVAEPAVDPNLDADLPIDTPGDSVESFSALESLFPTNLFSLEPDAPEPDAPQLDAPAPGAMELSSALAAPSFPARPTEPLPPDPTPPSAGVAAALSDDFLAELLGEAPVSRAVVPPALEVRAVPAEPAPEALAEQPTLDMMLNLASQGEDLFEELPGDRFPNPAERRRTSISAVPQPPVLPPPPAQPSSNASPPNLPAANEDITLSDLFNLSASVEPSPLPEDLSKTLDDFAIAMPAPAIAPPPAPAPPPPSVAQLTEFTLEGLDRLFEDLPGMEAPAAGAASLPASPEDLDLTLENLFGADFGSQASLDLYNQPPGDSTQKKRLN